MNKGLSLILIVQEISNLVQLIVQVLLGLALGDGVDPDQVPSMVNPLPRGRCIGFKLKVLIVDTGQLVQYIIGELNRSKL